MPTFLKSVITADTFFFTENRYLKVAITANRLVFWNRNTASRIKNYRKTAPKITQNRINANPYAPLHSKYFPTRIIHHNQLLLTKFGKNLCHIESLTSKVKPAENYWTIDVKMTSTVQPAADYWTVDRENLGQSCATFGERKNKERNGETPLRTRKYFEWIIKQLLNSAFVGYEEFCRSRRVLSVSAFDLCG